MIVDLGIPSGSSANRKQSKTEERARFVLTSRLVFTDREGVAPSAGVKAERMRHLIADFDTGQKSAPGKPAAASGRIFPSHQQFRGISDQAIKESRCCILGQMGLENYTFLTPETEIEEALVFGGFERRFVEGFLTRGSASLFERLPAAMESNLLIVDSQGKLRNRINGFAAV